MEENIMAGGTQVPVGQLSVKRIFRYQKKGQTFRVIEKCADGRVKVEQVSIFRKFTTYVEPETLVYKA